MLTKRGERWKNVYIRYGADAREGVKEILRAADVEREIRPGASVGLKPNLVVASPCSGGATTSPEVVAGAIEFLRDCGAGEITVMEGSWVGDDTKRAWRVCGYEALASRYGVRLLDLKDDRTKRVEAGGISLEVCASPYEADYFVNLPVLKGHCQTVLTCALKNLKGCIPDREKRRYHTAGLHKPIAALNAAMKPDLILVDALCGDPSFEEGGNPVEMNTIIAGRDPVKVDAFGTSLLGIPVSAVAYIGLAERLGVGTAAVAEGDIVRIGGDAPAVRAVPTSGIAGRYASFIEERGACSACYAALVHALYRLDSDGELPRIKKLKKEAFGGKIKIGQGFRDGGSNGLNSTEHVESVGVGNCASRFSRFIPGCPPSAEEIARELRNG